MRTCLFLAVVFTACSLRVTEIGTLDDAGVRDATMTLTGRACTQTPDLGGFRTRVILLVDQSGSMCLTDPPGSQMSMGFCEMHQSIPPGVVQPARVRALNRLVDALHPDPYAEVALVPYETNVMDPLLVPANSPQLRLRINSLQSQLGNASDLQGALEYAANLIEADVTALEQAQPELLARTRYVVVLLGDGAPYPRCSANDTLSTYADDRHPELTWADSTAYCNTASPSDPDTITGFVAGSDRNQNAQLFAPIERIRALRNTHHVGDVTVHTAMLFAEDAIAQCGPICQDFWGTRMRWPGPTIVPSDEAAEFAKAEGRWLYRELATRGGGVFLEAFGTPALGTFTLAGLDVGSLAAPNVLKRFLVQPLRAARFEGTWHSDKDGDGAIDELELQAGSDMNWPDTDDDGFDDLFELNHRDAGFDPLVKDARGCDPQAPLTAGCVSRDTDGDGLSQFAELHLGTSAVIADTDRDGFPDGFEVRHGLDPLVPMNPSADSDGDGLTDVQELLRGSDPQQADRAFADELGIEMVFQQEEARPDATTCYAFTASNLPLVAPPELQGYNLYKVWFAQAPETIVQNDSGLWSSACAWGRRDGEVQSPPNLVLTIPESAFSSLPNVSQMDYVSCVGEHP